MKHEITFQVIGLDAASVEDKVKKVASRYFGAERRYKVIGVAAQPGATTDDGRVVSWSATAIAVTWSHV